MASAAQSHPATSVSFGAAEGSLIMAAENCLIARVPDGAVGGAVRVQHGKLESAPFPMALGVQIADNLHPVGNPAWIPKAIFTSPSADSAARKFPFRFTKLPRTIP